MTEHLIVEQRGRAGLITLNRPKALNALSGEMAVAMREALDAWRDDPEVALVVVRGAGERGLCAGGDVVTLHRYMAEGNQAAANRYWADEYGLNLDIACYPKPYVAIQHGVVLGGGVGISAHGSHRIVTDDTRIGMPETAIGFSPDVGASYILARAPHNLGRHLALTGVHVGAAEAIAVGLADAYVPQDALEELVEKLVSEGDPAVIDTYAQTPPSEPFDGHLSQIEEAYEADSVEMILRNLETLDADWATNAAQAIRRNSPLATKIALEALRRARTLTLADTLTQDYRMGVHAVAGGEFQEGVRAQLVDKDRTPRWTPTTLGEVTPEMVSAQLAPVQDEPDFANA